MGLILICRLCSQHFVSASRLWTTERSLMKKKHELIPCTSETHEQLPVPKSNVKKWWSQKSPKSSESSERSGHKAASISHYAVLRESRYCNSSPLPCYVLSPQLSDK